MAHTRGVEGRQGPTLVRRVVRRIAAASAVDDAGAARDVPSDGVEGARDHAARCVDNCDSNDCDIQTVRSYGELTDGFDLHSTGRNA